MNIMRLKHRYGLVIIILLFHNVALAIAEEVDNEGDENLEQEEDNPEEEEDENLENDNEENIETDERNDEGIIKNIENVDDDEGIPYSIDGDERDSIEDEEQNSVEEEEMLKNSMEMKKTLLARKPATFHWSSGMVPYQINERDFDTIIAARIRTAMHMIMSSSCVVFKDISKSKSRSKSDSSPWLSIENPERVSECSHTTLREEGPHATKAILIVGYDCMQKRDILHSLLHALGFEDEVTHPRRDAYIRVVWPNISPRFRSLFYLKKSEPSQKVVEYDSMSVMHFHDRAYTINGGATILPQIPGLLIAPSDTLSQLDVMKLRLAFGHECNKRKVANLLRNCQNALKDNSVDEAQDLDSDVESNDSN